MTDIVGDYNPPLDGYFAHVLRTLGYHVTLRRLRDNLRNEQHFYDPSSGIQVESGGWFADYPLPSSFYELVSCGETGYVFSYCNRDLDHRAAAAIAMRQTDPGGARRTWTAVDRDVTDQAPLVSVVNTVNWWITSQRVGNYQNGLVDIGPLMSQLWVR